MLSSNPDINVSEMQLFSREDMVHVRKYAASLCLALTSDMLKSGCLVIHRGNIGESMDM